MQAVDDTQADDRRWHRRDIVVLVAVAVAFNLYGDLFNSNMFYDPLGWEDPFRHLGIGLYYADPGFWDLYYKISRVPWNTLQFLVRQLFTTAADDAAAGAVWSRFGLDRYARVVALNPGAAFGAAKHWGCDHFAALARRLTAELGCGVLVLCGPAERALARQIADESRSPHVFSLGDGPLSLGLTKALVRRADLLVTTDSGPRHFAAAFDRPVVALFGPTHVEWTETYFAREARLQKKLAVASSQVAGCFGTGRVALLVSVRAGNVEWVREKLVIVDTLGKATPVRISDYRFRAHELLLAVDANGDGIDDLATKAVTEHAGATTLLALDLKARKASRFAAGFAWEDQ